MFFSDIYGEYLNRIDREQFKEFLAETGWKYFTVRDLNTLFYIKLMEARQDGEEIESVYEDEADIAEA